MVGFLVKRARNVFIRSPASSRNVSPTHDVNGAQKQGQPTDELQTDTDKIYFPLAHDKSFNCSVKIAGRQPYACYDSIKF